MSRFPDAVEAEASRNASSKLKLIDAHRLDDPMDFYAPISKKGLYHITSVPKAKKIVQQEALKPAFEAGGGYFADGTGSGFSDTNENSIGRTFLSDGDSLLGWLQSIGHSVGEDGDKTAVLKFADPRLFSGVPKNLEGWTTPSMMTHGWPRDIGYEGRFEPDEFGEYTNFLRSMGLDRGTFKETHMQPVVKGGSPVLHYDRFYEEPSDGLFTYYINSGLNEGGQKLQISPAMQRKIMAMSMLAPAMMAPQEDPQ